MLSRVSLSVVTSLPDAAAADWSQAAASADSDEETTAAAASAQRCTKARTAHAQILTPNETRECAQMTHASAHVARMCGKTKWYERK